jgi:hypothetical protein
MAPARTAESKKQPPAKAVVAEIKSATGATEDEISAMLAECNYDVNEATTRLIDSALNTAKPAFQGRSRSF